jgi:hypothetical protein
MADTWWTIEEAATWVSARRPCRTFVACGLVMTGAEGGIIPLRYRRPDGQSVSIAPNEWVRTSNVGIKWEGWEQQDDLGFGAGEYEFQAAAVQRLCEPEPSKRGRPPKTFVPQLAAFGGAWLAANGTPDKKSALADALHEECDRRGWEYGNTQINSLAKELIAEYRAALDRS